MPNHLYLHSLREWVLISVIAEEQSLSFPIFSGLCLCLGLEQGLAKGQSEGREGANGNRLADTHCSSMQ
jgi:hypothetical protein